ncbi:MAG: 3-deoxy-D-manno-octulosonic acid transferase [Pseudomonadota bacterium]
MSLIDALSEPFGIRLYRGASAAAGPLAELALRRRLRNGKEDPKRIAERRGVAGRPRPEGVLVWIHGASVGESLSVLPLVKELHARRPDLRFLVTTGTVTSARLMRERLPQAAVHQFIPLDRPKYVDAFLAAWRPDVAVFVESEFWPNLILRARARTPFMALVNGRVSPQSFAQWTKRTRAIRYVLAAFDAIVAQDRQSAERLEALSGRAVATFGNLKNAAPPLPEDVEARAALNAQIGGRPVWLAASTHEGEEAPVCAAHRLIDETHKGVLTLLAPRRPERGAEVADICRAHGLRVARRSQGDAIAPDTDIYLADTLGELGLFYRLSDVAFVGGSLTDKGGHNPLEPARLHSAILHGPHTFNFVETYGEMRAAGGSGLVRNERELAAAVSRLLTDPKTRAAMADAANDAAARSAANVLAAVCDLILERTPAAPARRDAS